MTKGKTVRTKTHFKTDMGVLCKPAGTFDLIHQSASDTYLKTETLDEVTCARCLRVLDRYRKLTRHLTGHVR
jgi:hypothetical protein